MTSGFMGSKIKSPQSILAKRQLSFDPNDSNGFTTTNTSKRLNTSGQITTLTQSPRSITKKRNVILKNWALSTHFGSTRITRLETTP